MYILLFLFSLAAHAAPPLRCVSAEAQTIFTLHQEKSGFHLSLKNTEGEQERELWSADLQECVFTPEHFLCSGGLGGADLLVDARADATGKFTLRMLYNGAFRASHAIGNCL